MPALPRNQLMQRPSLDSIVALRTALVEKKQCRVRFKDDSESRVISIQRFAKINRKWYVDFWCHGGGELAREPLTRVLESEVDRSGLFVIPREALAEKWRDDQDREVVHQYPDSLGQIDLWITKCQEKLKDKSKDTESDEGAPSTRRHIKPVGESPRAPRPSGSTEHSKDFGFRIDGDAEQGQRLVSALDALICEMKETGSNRKSIRLTGAEPQSFEGYASCFRFPVDSELNVFEGMTVKAKAADRWITGKLVSVTANHLLVGFDEEIDGGISECLLEFDNTSLFERLRSELASTLKDGSTDFNKRIAQAVITGKDIRRVSREMPMSFSPHLNAGQIRAIKNGLSKSVSYIWGPPGTGKTLALGELVGLLHARKEKILVCSNTNQAVDQLLLKLCASFGKKHDAIKEGQVIRIGQIEHQGLQSEWGDLINIDSIADRKGKTLVEQKRKTESKLRPLKKELEQAGRIAASFDRLRKIQKDWSSVSERLLKAKNDKASIAKEIKTLTTDAAQKLKDAKRKLTDFTLQKRRLAQEAKKRELAVLKIAHRSQKLIEIDQGRVEETIIEVTKLLEKIPLQEKRDQDRLQKRRDAVEKQVESLKGGQAALFIELESARKEVDGIDESDIREKITTLKGKIDPLEKILGELNKKLAALRASVMNEAKVIGATVTKSHLEPATFRGVDVVIIDEASMVHLPAIYFVAGLAKKSVVVSGDFQQLQPIIETRQKILADEIGCSVFRKSGIQEQCEREADVASVAMLDAQYRMPESVCRLISIPFYNGRLKTEKSGTDPSDEMERCFPRGITIVDTSSLNPLEQFSPGKSRYNLIHAEVVRSIVRVLQNDNGTGHAGSVGICSPYSAQAELLKAVIEDEGEIDRIRVRTAHRWQGDEADTFILDIPTGATESPGTRVGRFLDREETSDDNAKVLNVAFSRARQCLVIVANLKELNKKLPNYAVLRDLLSRAEEYGAVVAGKKFLNQTSIKSIFSAVRRIDSLPQRSVQDIYIDNATGDRSSVRRKKQPEKTVRNTERRAQTNSGTTTKAPIIMANAQEFSIKVQEDILAAQEMIAIFSGFITKNRVEAYRANFEDRIRQGVAIRCVTRPPGKNTSARYMQESARDALKKLKKIGCEIDLRDDIHQKIVIIDEKIVWFGSCNPLSHTSERTDETMQRTEGVKYARQLANFISVDRSRQRLNQRGVSIVKENPVCPRCGSSWTVLKKRAGNSKANPWRCAKKGCGHTWRS